MLHHRQLALSLLGLTATVFAQAPATSQFTPHSWWERNTAATVLAATPATASSDLFDALHADWAEQNLQSKAQHDILAALSSADSAPAQQTPTLEEVCDIRPTSKWWPRAWGTPESLNTAHS